MVIAFATAPTNRRRQTEIQSVSVDARQLESTATGTTGTRNEPFAMRPVRERLRCSNRLTQLPAFESNAGFARAAAEESVSTALVEYAKRMAGKRVAKRADIANYTSRGSGAYDLDCGGKIVRLPSQRILGYPRPESPLKSTTPPPLWDSRENRPLGPGEDVTLVDHRMHQTPVKDQGERATCVAFAALAQIEARIKADEHREIDLSEQYTHWRFMQLDARDQYSDIFFVRDAAYCLANYGVCEESFAPYQDKVTIEGNGAAGPSADARINARYGIRADYYPLTLLGHPNITNLDYLEALLHGGLDVVVGMEIALIKPDGDGVFDVWLDGNNRPISLGKTNETPHNAPGHAPGHAMLLVGYDKRGPKPFFIVKNSWGQNAGDGGYFYLSYDYFSTYAKMGYVISGIRSDMPIED